MRIIRISEEVWQVIASRGKFGETEDDVLRRVFDLPPNSMNEGVQTLTGGGADSYRTLSGRRRSFAKQRMSSYVGANQLHIEFHGGASSSWTLPDRNDKAGIRAVLDKAILFATNNGASVPGQTNAVRKTLTDKGYYLTKISHE
jgi:hypothetical protein